MSTSRSDCGGRGAARGLRVALLALAAASALAAGGCLPPNRTEFIETLAREHRKVERAAYAFGQTLEPMSSGKAANASDVRSAYNELDKAIKDVRSEMNFQMLPPNAPHGSDLLEAYKAYLDAEEAQMQGPVLKIVEQVELPFDENGKPDANDRYANIKPLRDQIRTQDATDFAKLNSVQNQYGGDHNYQVYGLDAYIANQKGGK
jgi:hypothetical protein